VTVDVKRTTLILADGEEVSFPLDAFARTCLVDGIDELEYLRRHETAIAVWEARHG
jgi:3-isopropylmalate/(R)-2-methylmalate dehydratase small subunit